MSENDSACRWHPVLVDFAAIASKPAAAAMTEAVRHGFHLPLPIAEAVARAVLECADDEHRAEGWISGEIYNRTYGSSVRADAIAELERRLRQRAAYDIAEAGVLPTALPRKVVTAPAAPWEPARMELVVPVRRPLS